MTYITPCNNYSCPNKNSCFRMEMISPQFDRRVLNPKDCGSYSNTIFIDNEILYELIHEGNYENGFTFVDDQIFYEDKVYDSNGDSHKIYYHELILKQLEDSSYFLTIYKSHECDEYYNRGPYFDRNKTAFIRVYPKTRTIIETYYTTEETQ